MSMRAGAAAPSLRFQHEAEAAVGAEKAARMHAEAEELHFLEETRRLMLIADGFQRQITDAAEATALAVARTQAEKAGLAVAEERLTTAGDQLGVLEASFAAVTAETRHHYR